MVEVFSDQSSHIQAESTRQLLLHRGVFNGQQYIHKVYIDPESIHNMRCNIRR